MQRRAHQIGQGVITALAFGVGVLVGGRFCQPQPQAPQAQQAARVGQGVGDPSDPNAASDPSRSPCEPTVVERLVQAPAQIIYECPPEPPAQPAGAGRGEAKKVAPKPAPELPEPEPDLDPLERQRLLAWVRDQSEALKRCRDDQRQIYRLAVTLHLDRKTRALRRVDVNADRDELPGAVAQCLRREILTWRPPAELTKQRTKIVFGLNL